MIALTISDVRAATEKLELIAQRRSPVKASLAPLLEVDEEEEEEEEDGEAPFLMVSVQADQIFNINVRDPIDDDEMVWARIVAQFERKFVWAGDRAVALGGGFIRMRYSEHLRESPIR